MTRPVRLAAFLAVVGLLVALDLGCAAPPATVGATDERAPRAEDAATAKKEIVELHRFFAGWLTGRLERSDKAFARFEGVLAPSFVHVGPNGARTSGADLCQGLRSAYGQHVRDGFEIRIENVQAQPLAGGYVVATYEEWQRTKQAKPRGRISSVLFKVRAGTPNGLEWLHVHETWLSTVP